MEFRPCIDIHNGKVKQIDEDTYLLMYSTLIDLLAAHGYEHYEISCIRKKESKEGILFF